MSNPSSSNSKISCKVRNRWNVGVIALAKPSRNSVWFAFSARLSSILHFTWWNLKEIDRSGAKQGQRKPNTPQCSCSLRCQRRAEGNSWCKLSWKWKLRSNKVGMDPRNLIRSADIAHCRSRNFLYSSRQKRNREKSWLPPIINCCIVSCFFLFFFYRQTPCCVLCGSRSG